MALIFLGVTECALCGKVLKENDKVTSLPPIGDIQHPLYKYFDAGLHTQCFENWDKKEEKRKFKNSEHYKEMAAKYGRPKWLEED